MSDVMEVKSVDIGSSIHNRRDSFAEKWLERQILAGQRDGIFTITVDLTPELAELLIARNPDNRKISEGKTRQYADDILSGRWLHNGEPVIIADTGELNDGQHRCRAVIRAGKSILTQVTFGAARSSRYTIDSGIKRTVGQHLGMKGMANSYSIAGAAGLIIAFRKYKRFNVHGFERPTPSEVMEWVATHPEIADHISVGERIARKLRISKSLISAIHYLFSEKSRTQADEFFNKLEDGAELQKGEAIYSLRNQLIRNIGAPAKLSKNEIAGRIVKAWNHYRKGKSVNYLRRVGGGDSQENFPIPE